MSLSNKLFNSRKYDSKTGKYYYESPMVDLVKELEEAAKQKGLNVSRWQANRGRHDCTVTWAVHHGDRPEYSRDLPESALVVSFRGIEGKTSRCAAYKEVRYLLDEVNKL